MVRFQLAFTLHDKPITTCLRPPARHNAGLLIVPTCQHSKMDLVQTGEVVEEEKDALLENVQCNSLLVQRALLLVSCLCLSNSDLLAVHGVCQGSVQQSYRQGPLGRLH